MMATFEMLKATISTQKKNGTLNKYEMLKKLDLFLTVGRITSTEYEELIKLIG